MLLGNCRDLEATRERKVGLEQAQPLNDQVGFERKDGQEAYHQQGAHEPLYGAIPRVEPIDRQGVVAQYQTGSCGFHASLLLT